MVRNLAAVSVHDIWGDISMFTDDRQIAQEVANATTGIPSDWYTESAGVSRYVCVGV